MSCVIKSLQVNTFILYTAPEPLDKNIVPVTAFAIHADPYIMLFNDVTAEVFHDCSPTISKAADVCWNRFASDVTLAVSQPDTSRALVQLEGIGLCITE